MSWDTKFFGFPVARILLPSLLPEQLSAVLADLKRNRVRLAYWITDELPPAETSAVQALGGYACPLRFTYKAAILEEPGASTESISYYTDRDVSADLRALAIESGMYSRFRLDPQFPAGKFEELYSLWIENSVNRKICDEVLVYRALEEIAGMVTVGREGGNGKIGLIAVNANYRGQGVGTALMAAASSWFRAQNLDRATVVTQGKNLGAARLYEKSGFQLSRRQSTFHFWL